MDHAPLYNRYLNPILSKHNLDQSPLKYHGQIRKILPNARKKKKKGRDGKRLNLLGAKAITQCTSFSSPVAGLIYFCKNDIFLFYLRRKKSNMEIQFR